MSKPTQFDERIAETLLERIRDGESLRRICIDESMPNKSTVWLWQNGKNGAPSIWAGQYARAYLFQADSFAHDILDIADNIDDIARLNAQRAVENLPINTSHVQRTRTEFFAKRRSLEGARLSIDARKFLASKINSRKWGDKVVLEIETNEQDEFKVQLKDVSTTDLLLINELRNRLREKQSSEKEVIEIPAEV